MICLKIILIFQYLVLSQKKYMKQNIKKNNKITKTITISNTNQEQMK